MSFPPSQHCELIFFLMFAGKISSFIHGLGMVVRNVCAGTVSLGGLVPALKSEFGRVHQEAAVVSRCGWYYPPILLPEGTFLSAIYL